MDPNGKTPFKMPNKIEIIKEKSQVGQISSTEIRTRIKEAKQRLIEKLKEKENELENSEES